MSGCRAETKTEGMVINPDLLARSHKLLLTLYKCRDPAIARAGEPSPFSALSAGRGSA